MKTLFEFPEIYISGVEKYYSIKITREFLVCADLRLTRFFENYSGIKVNSLVSVGWVSVDEFFYNKGSISKFASNIWINHNINFVTIAWKSNSGRIYGPGDKDICCEDIEFWYEGLDPLLYHKQMFPKLEHPFKLKNLSYQLTIHRLNMDCCIEMFLKKEHSIGVEIILSNADKFIDDFNTASEKKDRKYGVVHNWNHHVENNKLVYNIDMGFSGPYFLKQFIEYLSKLNAFEKVTVG